MAVIHMILFDGPSQYQFYCLVLFDFPLPFFEFENKMVWGLTAYMTVEFLKLLDIEIDLTRK